MSRVIETHEHATNHYQRSYLELGLTGQMRSIQAVLVVDSCDDSYSQAVLQEFDERPGHIISSLYVLNTGAP